MGDPDAAAFVLQEEPVAGLVVGRVGRGEGVSGEGSISIIKGDGEIEIGGEFGVRGEELRSDFAVAGGDELGASIDWFVRNFVVKVAAELLS